MDPHIDDELKEYLRLIDATVKSASVNHISPEKGAFASFPQQLKANELFQNGIKLINNFDEKEQKSSHYPKRKKPEILDDSIDWNIGSQQTTLESPKSQDDIKDLCLGIQSLQCGNNSQNQQNQQSQLFSSFNCISASSQFFQKLQRFFPEQQPGDQLNLSCLCSLDPSSKPSRNVVIQLSQQDDLEQFLGFIRSYGDIQNIDHHKYQLEKIVVLSFYNIQSSLSAFQSLSQSYANKMKVSYLSDFNDFDYIDYMLISNANSFNQKLVLDYLGCFGKILEYSSLNSKLVVRYFDVRSLKEVDRIIKLQEKDRKSFIYLHRAHFPEVEEKFIQELLKNILIFSKENTTDIILKNARVKSVKQNAPLIQQQQQQLIQTKQNEGISSQQLGLMPTSPNNTSSPAIPSGLELGYNQRLNSYSFFNSNNTLNPIQQQTINNIFNNYYNIDENTNNSFQVIQPNKQDNLYQQTYSAQNQNQQPQLYGYQQRRELQEISDYQNTLVAQQTLSQNNKFLSSNSSNSLSAQIDNQSYINNENENIYTCKQLQQKKQKKMNPNVNNFSSFNYNSNGSNSNNDNTNNNNGSSLKLLQNSFSGNILQASCHQPQPQLKQNNSQMNNMNQLQQSISNLQMSQEIGSSSQQIQYLQQISQSSSSSLSSTNFPQYNQGGYFSNNFNQLRKSQEENPFSASSLRMSFDNNQIYQINSSFYQSNNNNSQTNTNPMNNSQNLNNQMITSQNNAVTGQLQVRLQNSQQTQFMNLLNNNNQFLNEVCFNNPQNPNMVEQYEVTQMQNNLNGQVVSNRQYPNQINLHNNYQPSQSQSKVSTILGSNGTKQNNNLNFQVNLENISSFKDRRATIMVRNIPNRYNQEDFLRIIDINYKGLYDFVYLPMDFKNHCNIGYAFINFIDPKHIIPFYNEFNGKRWEMIRSEKVCYICYARIQGRNELIAHFKKSGVMSALVDKSFKPLILPNPTLDLQILQQ